MGAEDTESLPVLSQAALEEMRYHLEHEHGLGFEPRRDISHAGNIQPEALLTHRAETPGAAEGFWCAECPGAVFLVAMEPELSPERIDHLARRDGELRQRLVGIAPEDRAEFIKAYQEERSGALLLARARRRSRMRTTTPQPAAQERREGAQAYLLSIYEEIGSVEEALWALAQLLVRDPKAYRRVMGTDRAYAVETLRKYWQAIPAEERTAAKQRFLASIHRFHPARCDRLT